MRQRQHPFPRRRRRAVLTGLLLLVGAWLVACATGVGSPGAAPPRFANAYPAVGDTGERAPFTYFFRRAWVQLTRDMDRTPLPPTAPLDVASLQQREFAVAWLGHSALLVRAGERWLLMDPTLDTYVGPLRGFGPKRLTPLPLPLDALPHIDAVLISHDHYDHMDLASLRRLAKQPGGPPRFFAGLGLKAWFADNLGVVADELGWWDTRALGGLRLTFVPAQHNSGRSVGDRNRTLWGGWVVERSVPGASPLRFYFAGDTAWVPKLFADLSARIGPIHLAALPIGAYTPSQWMQHEHTNPHEAALAHQALGAARSFGVHWATFQLGDEEPMQPAHDLADATRRLGVASFGVLPIGGVLDVARE